MNVENLEFVASFVRLHDKTCVQRDSFSTVAFGTRGGAGGVNQNLSHHAAREGKEMGPPLNFRMTLSEELDIGFMDQDRGLQGRRLTIASHMARSQSAQVL